MMIKKLNQLEKCKVKGWLDFGDKRITSLDRLQAGNKLFIDFTKCCFPSARAINYEQDRVDGGNMKNLSESIIMARHRFNQAIKIFPKYSPQWFMVQAIVLEDRKVVVRKMTSRQYNHEMELLKEDLCQGLDALAYHYGVTPFKPLDIKNHEFVEQEFAETPRNYIFEI